MKKISKNLISFLMLIAITMPIMGCKSPTIPEHRITFNVGSAKEWNEAVYTIETGDAGESYVINVRNDFELPGTENPTFGNATDISVEIKGKYTLTQSSAGSLIYIGSGQNVTVSNIVMKGGVCVSGASAVFTMKEKATLEGIGGCGVLVTDHGILNMQDNASIKKNATAVRIYSGGSFNMSGGTISDNHHSGMRTGCSGVWIKDGFFEMSGGTISKNTSQGIGGDVFLEARGDFTMSGGNISRFIYIYSNSVFTMIEGNIAGSVNIGGNSIFTMLDGKISNHSMAVYISGGGTFKMMNGTISGSEANQGSGVSLSQYGKFVMFGGTIHGSQENDINRFTLHCPPTSNWVAQYGDETNILPHTDGHDTYTRHTIVGKQSRNENKE